MPEAAVLPSRRDEAWRYADIGALERLSVDALGQWKDITLAPGETRSHCMVVGSDSPELHRIRLTLGEGARAEMFTVIAGSESCRVEIEVTLAKGAHFEFGGVTIGGGTGEFGATREFVTQVVHAEPDATSNQTIRSVHWGQGTGNFLGEIKVLRDAQRTDAAQDFKGLLLEKGASANAVPQLEIFADDVKCAHGATVGQLDEAGLFYLRSRGLDEGDARNLLTYAFAAEALSRIESEPLRRRAEAAIRSRLPGGEAMELDW